MEVGARRFAFAAVAGAAWLVSDLGLQAVGGGAARALGLAAAPVAAAGAAVACSAAAVRAEGAARRGWALFALSAVAWTVADLSALGPAGGGALSGVPLERPAAALPEALAAVGVVLPVLAVLSFLSPAFSSTERMRVLLDALLVASALAFAGWALVFGSLPGAAREGPLAVALPAGDVVLVALVVVTLGRVPRAARLSWLLLAGGLGLLAVASTAASYVEAAGLGSGGHANGTGALLGGLLVALAATAPGATQAPAASEDGGAGGVWSVLLPMVPVAGAGALAGVLEYEGRLTPVLLYVGSPVLALLVARQLVSEFGYLELAQRLEARVRERTAALSRQEQRFRSITKHASDVLSVVGPDLVVRYQSASVQRVLGYGPEELLGTRIDALFAEDARSALLERLRTAPAPPASPTLIEARVRRRDGTWCWTETAVSNLLADPAVGGVLLTMRDIEARRQLEDQLRRQALHDPLTGLANRIVLHDRLEQALARLERRAGVVALVMLDLDEFKQVNDSLGHGVGDQLLVEVARRLRASARSADTVARMGGDEFALIVEAPSEEAVTVVASRLLNRLRAPVELEGRMVFVQGSIGIATTSDPHSGAEVLIRDADLAMYSAKSGGKGRFEVFRPAMHAAALARVELETGLREALREEELVVHYQPVVELATGAVVGAEALVRWQHPTRGLLAPAAFVPLAEGSDLILALGRFVLKEACRQAARLQRVVPGRFSISVNVSVRQLRSPFFVREVAEVLDESGLDPASLMLEITEGALGTDTGASAPNLSALRRLGVRFAIDDFGTGWSSLGRLRSFPVDAVKIDKSFVDDIVAADQDVPIIGAIVAMARSLGLETIAEGVERPEQAACLARYGCEKVQGYLLSRPVPLGAFEAFLEQPAPAFPLSA